MTQEELSAIYKMAKAIYNKEERLVNGKEKLFYNYKINKNSFADFYRAFQKMLDGELHTRGINTELRDYYLSQIYKDYGATKLRTALKAYMDFILYYESSHNNTKRNIERNIHQKYCNILNKTSSTKAIEDEINTYWEGSLGQETITTHERNIDARNKCIQIKGIKCFVCGFDFEKTYGELGKGYIHVHHVTPMSNKYRKYELNIENDLFPVCPNCHAMLHRNNKLISIEGLKQIIQQNQFKG